MRSKQFRQYIGILSAAAVYYLIHEGAHLISALYFGTFQTIHFMGLGIQVDVYAGQMTGLQLGIFCLSGVAATLVSGWLLVLLAKKICQSKSLVFKAAMWYISLALLLLDPVYLSILCSLFGGGDMNGIRLLMPEIPARLLFGAIGFVHCLVVWKYLLPTYTNAFSNE